MGEYYSWVNIDKKEYISPYEFDLGLKLYESAFAGNQLLGALYDLLSSDWRGDALVFLGDQTEVEENETNPVLRRLFEQRKAWGENGNEYDYAEECFKNISGLYKAAETVVREEIDGMIELKDFSFNIYHVDPSVPYEHLFVREPRFFRFTVNHTKCEFYDIEKTKLTYKNKSEVPTIRIDPLPILLAYPGRGDKCTGLWLGDSIEVTDTAPHGYMDMSEVYCCDYI